MMGQEILETLRDVSDGEPNPNRDWLLTEQRINKTQ